MVRLITTLSLFASPVQDSQFTRLHLSSANSAPSKLKSPFASTTHLLPQCEPAESLAPALRKRPHRSHSLAPTLSLFSYSCALFCSDPNLIPNRFCAFRTLWAKHPGWGVPLASHHRFSLNKVESPLATIFSAINTYKTASKQTTLRTFGMSIYAKTGGGSPLWLTRNPAQVARQSFPLPSRMSASSDLVSPVTVSHTTAPDPDPQTPSRLARASHMGLDWTNP